MFTETHGPRRHTNFLRFYGLFVFMAGRLLCLDTERPESSSPLPVPDMKMQHRWPES